MRKRGETTVSNFFDLGSSGTGSFVWNVSSVLSGVSDYYVSDDGSD